MTVRDTSSEGQPEKESDASDKARAVRLDLITQASFKCKGLSSFLGTSLASLTTSRLEAQTLHLIVGVAAK